MGEASRRGPGWGGGYKGVISRVWWEGRVVFDVFMEGGGRGGGGGSSRVEGGWDGGEFQGNISRGEFLRLLESRFMPSLRVSSQYGTKNKSRSFNAGTIM